MYVAYLNERGIEHMAYKRKNEWNETRERECVCVYRDSGLKYECRNTHRKLSVFLSETEFQVK